MKKEDLHGFVPAVVTPFNEVGDIMEDAFQSLVSWLIGQGASAICVSGDNGESWALSAAEKGRLTRLAVDEAAGRVPVITGCSATTLKNNIDFALAAKENGAAAVLSMPQTYVLKTTRDELLGRFEKLTAAIDMPIVAYNSPRRAGLNLTIDDIGAIMDVAPIIGIKESNRDYFHHTHLINRFADKMAIMVGPCHYIMPGIALGASGFIATGPEFLGADTANIVALAKEKPGAKQAEVHHKLTVLYELLMGHSTWPAAFKAALNLIGQPAGVPRDPVYAATDEVVDAIKKKFDELGISYGQ
ncbi:MAG: dihydrodipicolinate synthase family protein [Kordiimonadaceae bacterium]|jgi:4-hydroxy-tetrahydrodipicolinate synthase|nr:dihydrodipicolinate synthase family protein [Kordiimonadaceae bacterium]MDB4044005.1 dihydrodipicolinate synthase family protein [Emcibacteraceae bacterium]MBT6134989.1 dihydrodipicolinate synthase family protein [Kordiimonadaceae bacterium]MBT6467528.1 dihydrodipicolinate synthase family protein [Kordiimonadaceae bacterium]MBT7544013.1 dihydrodipicolinate synthase family protein [Kordiimonadaceae bacterium]